MSVHIRRIRKRKRNSNITKKLFREYEKTTGESPIWNNNITLGFKIWLAEKEKLNNK